MTSNNQSNLLETANKHYEKACILVINYTRKRRSESDEAIKELKQCLLIRESSLGRYHIDVAYVYAKLGEAYKLNCDEHNATVSYCTCLRIEKYLGISVNNINISWKTALTTKQLESKIHDSLQYEKDGDLNRTKGNFTVSIQKYYQAIVEEKECIGSEITLPFLWRKIALLVGRKDDKYIGLRTNWNQLDQIDGTKPNSHGLLDEVYELVRHGDEMNAQCNYQHALESYQKVSDIVRDQKLSNEKLEFKIIMTEMMELQVQNKLDQVKHEILAHVEKKLNQTESKVMEGIDNILGYIGDVKECQREIIERLEIEEKHLEKTGDWIKKVDRKLNQVEREVMEKVEPKLEQKRDVEVSQCDRMDYMKVAMTHFAKPTQNMIKNSEELNDYEKVVGHHSKTKTKNVETQSEGLYDGFVPIGIDRVKETSGKFES